MNSDSGGLYAAIGGIVLVYGMDRVTKNRYKVDARKESFTLEPATVTDDTEKKPAEESENKHCSIQKKTVSELITPAPPFLWVQTNTRLNQP